MYSGRVVVCCHHGQWRACSVFLPQRAQRDTFGGLRLGPAVYCMLWLDGGEAAPQLGVSLLLCWCSVFPAGRGRHQGGAQPALQEDECGPVLACRVSRLLARQPAKQTRSLAWAAACTPPTRSEVSVQHISNPTFRSAFCHNAFITRPPSWIPASLLCRRGSRQPGPAADVNLPKGGTKARGRPAATGPACTRLPRSSRELVKHQTGQTQLPGAGAGSPARCRLRTVRAPGAARPAQRPPGRRHARPPPHPRRRPRAPPAARNGGQQRPPQWRAAAAMAGGPESISGMYINCVVKVRRDGVIKVCGSRSDAPGPLLEVGRCGCVCFCGTSPPSRGVILSPPPARFAGGTYSSC